MVNMGAKGIRVSKDIHRSIEESQTLVFGEGEQVGWMNSNKKFTNNREDCHQLLELMETVSDRG